MFPLPLCSGKFLKLSAHFSWNKLTLWVTTCLNLHRTSAVYYDKQYGMYSAVQVGNVLENFYKPFNTFFLYHSVFLLSHAINYVKFLL